MSLPYLEMCLSKKPFKRQAHAENRAKQLGMRAYFCPICQNYHLTSKETPEETRDVVSLWGSGET